MNTINKALVLSLLYLSGLQGIETSMRVVGTIQEVKAQNKLFEKKPKRFVDILFPTLREKITAGLAGTVTIFIIALVYGFRRKPAKPNDLPPQPPVRSSTTSVSNPPSNLQTQETQVGLPAKPTPSQVALPSQEFCQHEYQSLHPEPDIKDRISRTEQSILDDAKVLSVATHIQALQAGNGTPQVLVRSESTDTKSGSEDTSYDSPFEGSEESRHSSIPPARSFVTSSPNRTQVNNFNATFPSSPQSTSASVSPVLPISPNKKEANVAAAVPPSPSRLDRLIDKADKKITQAGQELKKARHAAKDLAKGLWSKAKQSVISPSKESNKA